LGHSKTWHYSFYSTQTGTKKQGNKAWKDRRPATNDRLLTPNPTNKLFAANPI
jgi:hypothetical protein